MVSYRGPHVLLQIWVNASCPCDVTYTRAASVDCHLQTIYRKILFGHASTLYMRAHIGRWRLHASSYHASLCFGAACLQYRNIYARDFHCNRRIWVSYLNIFQGGVKGQQLVSSYLETQPTAWRFYWEHWRSRRWTCVFCSPHWSLRRLWVSRLPHQHFPYPFFSSSVRALFPPPHTNQPVGQIYEHRRAHNQQR